MSTLYPDLTNDYPDVDSDTRYLFNDLTINDVPYINSYETLVNNTKSATDTTSRNSAWAALQSFIGSTDYTTHVEPFIITPVKMQTLEDKCISAQRYAKRTQRQCVFSTTQPLDSAQSVGDIWYKIISTDSTGIVTIDMYRKTASNTYQQFSAVPALTTDNIQTTEDGWYFRKGDLTEALGRVDSTLYDAQTDLSTHKDSHATASAFSHVKLSDNYTTSAGAASAGIGASSKAVNDTYAYLKKLIDSNVSTLNSSITTVNTKVDNTSTSLSNLSTTVSQMKTSFQAGVDSIYDAIVAQGTTPASKSLSDVVVGIGNLNQVYKLGTGTSFNVSGISGYKNFTAANFLAVTTASLSVSEKTISGNNYQVSSGFTAPTISYNASTGVVSVSKPTASYLMYQRDGGGNPTNLQNPSSSGNPTVYLITNSSAIKTL